MKLRHFLIVCVIAILGITATVFSTTKYFPPRTQALGPLDFDVSDGAKKRETRALGPLDLDASDGAKETVTVDFIWLHGLVGSIKLEKVEGLHVYVCGLEWVTQSESEIVCEIRLDKDGNSVGGTMRRSFHSKRPIEDKT